MASSMPFPDSASQFTMMQPNPAFNISVANAFSAFKTLIFFALSASYAIAIYLVPLSRSFSTMLCTYIKP